MHHASEGEGVAPEEGRRGGERGAEHVVEDLGGVGDAEELGGHRRLARADAQLETLHRERLAQLLCRRGARGGGGRTCGLGGLGGRGVGVGREEGDGVDGEADRERALRQQVVLLEHHAHVVHVEAKVVEQPHQRAA